MKFSDFYFIILVLLELFSLFFFFKEGLLSHPFNAVLYCVSGICVGLLLLFKFYNKEVNNCKAGVGKTAFLISLLSIAGIALTFLKTRTIIQETPISKFSSDIIPAIQIMVRKFLSGHDPYTPMTELGYTGPAGYMPMHWLPFTVSETLGFDYRFIVFAVWFVSVLILLYRSLSINSVVKQGVIMLLLLGSYYYVAREWAGIIGITVEILIASYYMMLITGLNQKNYLVEALFISFCLLSRYTIMFWLPLWAFTLFISGQKRRLTWVTASAVFLCCLFYIIPFLSRDWSVFFETARSYSNLSWEWTHVDENGKPYHLNNGIGFAHFFYESYKDTDYMQGFKLLRKVFFAVTIGSVFLMGLWFWRKKERIDARIFLLASFKIYLTIFLSFILVPYIYLMITGSFVSFAIFAEQARYKISGTKKPAGDRRA